MKRPIVLFLALAGLVAACAPPETAAPPAPDQGLENQRAFAKLYGYVRFFHPSDAAAALDWDRFAVHGSRAVANAADATELAGILNDLFAPIAPTMIVYTASDQLAAEAVSEADRPTRDLVFWQHVGIGLGNPGPYRSSRVNRPQSDNAASGFGNVMRAIDATPYRGLDVRLSAVVRTNIDAPEGGGHVWIRVDRGNEETAFFDNMDDRPITSAVWKSYEIIGDVADDATNIAFGVFLRGKGWLSFDDVTLSVREPDGAWRPVAIANPGFEAANDAWPGWHEFGNAYAFSLTDADVFGGSYSMTIRSDADHRPGQLFDAVPDARFVDKPLGAGLRARVPIALPDAPMEFAAYVFSDETAAADLPVDDIALRYAGITVAWNLFQHFYPYFDVVDVDWDAQLTAALEDAADDSTRADYLDTLRRLVAAAEDGHGFVGDLRDRPSSSGPPFEVNWIEDRVVVCRTGNTDDIEPGDIIVSIDGRDARELVDEQAALHSGTLRWRRHRVLEQFGAGEPGSTLDLVLDRDGERIEFSVVRNRQGRIEPSRAEFEALGEREYYVDLTRIEWDALAGHIDELADANTIVFDMRGYPKGNHLILTHLYDESLQSAFWNVPRILYPDRERIVHWGDPPGRWLLPAGEPRINARIAFLIDAGAISYAESVMGIVEFYGLGAIVGEATAGTNGNVNYTDLPGGFRLVFTGMRVIKHDGSQHHLVGIQPTAPVQPTIAGVRSGMDEVLDAALAEIRRESN